MKAVLTQYKVGDLNIWNQHDPRERFWAARTRQLQSSHMMEGDRLWSNLPFMRPLCGILRDGCEIKDAAVEAGQAAGKNGGREERRDARGGVTKWGGRCHDLLGTRCDPYGTYQHTHFATFLHSKRAMSAIYVHVFPQKRKLDYVTMVYMY